MAMSGRRPPVASSPRRRGLRSLTARLILAFALVSIVGIGLAALLAHRVTLRQFEQFFLDKNRTEYLATVVAYYEQRGDWSGIDARLREQAPRRVDGLPAPPAFALADEQGVIVSPAAPYRAGDAISQGARTASAPVLVAGRMVGMVLDADRQPRLSDREQAYLAATNRALSLAALGSVAIALLLGALLARGLTRPLRDLTRAVQAMARGDLRQEVAVRGADEIGNLTLAFNQMSADLARANDLRRQMTADIAHDLRTPLTVITGYLEALRDGMLPPSAERYEAMYTEAQHLSHLVEDLRTLSLADAGELSLLRRRLPVGALLDRVVSVYRHRAGQLGVALESHCGAGVPDIAGDEERLAQVLGNLVENALRHTTSGGHVALTAYPRDGAARIVVEDDGEGITPEALPHVFDRFYRADPSRQAGDGESGLGLAIARSIVLAHGGTISVSSERARGTKVTITMPPWLAGRDAHDTGSERT